MVLYLASYPLLPLPEWQGGNQNTTIDLETVNAIIGEKMAEIGSKMWDKYIDNLEEIKQRIREYLESPRYQVWLAERSPAFIAKVERDTPEEMKSAIRSSTEFHTWINSLPPLAREDEINQITAHKIWTNFIDGTSDYIHEQSKDNPEAAAFMVASFVITSAFIGNYMNIVDVASTDMVAVTPIQDAVVALSPAEVQKQFVDSSVLVINLFAIPLAYQATAGLALRGVNGGEAPKDLEFAKGYAESVIEKVKGGEVNLMIMALLVHAQEDGQPISEDRVNQLATMAKMTMIAVALAVLYKAESGWIKGQEFLDMVEGGLEPRTEEEGILVKMFEELRANLPGEEGNNIVEALARYFNRNPSLDSILNPMKTFSGVVRQLYQPEQRG